jgi:Protein of unknown function (DUF1761)
MHLEFSSINWLAVLLATLASFILGSLWYGPLFGKQWLRLVGLSQEQLEGTSPASMFVPALILTFIQASFLAVLLPTGSGWLGGAEFGLFLGTGIVATAFGVNYVFSQHGPALWGIDAIFNVLQLTLMGVIIGAWP